MAETLSIFVAIWLYGGRSLLLSLVSQLESNRLTLTTSFVIGLLFLPCLLIIEHLVVSGYWLILAALVLIDGLLLTKLVQSRQKSAIDLRSVFLFGSLICSAAFLTLFNGSFIEQLSDAWWHMRNVSLEGSNTPAREIGFNGNSYRAQSFLAWLSNSTILNAWSSSAVAVSALLAVSVLLLFHSVGNNSVLTVTAFFCWLIILGGMNSGLRLTAWPAGMGYVFLNLGLVACYRIYVRFSERSGWELLVASLVGMALFHIGEIFLVLFAFGSTLTISGLLWPQSKMTAIGWLLLSLAAIGGLFLLNHVRDDYIADSVYLVSAAFCIGLWLIGVITSQTSHISRQIIGSLIAAILAYWVIDWHHLLNLFSLQAGDGDGFYSSYIPHWISVGGSDYVRLPKWDHQLRASLLWTSIATLPLSIYLYFRLRNPLSRWLLLLTFIPFLVLLSPALFTLFLTVIPEHGVYRIQFLMPVALVISLSLITAIGDLVTNEKSGIPSFFQTQSRQQLITVVAAMAAAVAVIYLLDTSFNAFAAPFSLAAGLLIAIVIFCIATWWNCSLAQFVGVWVILGCILSLVPDMQVRFNQIADRPWAVHSNIAFHWRWTDNNEVMEKHTSLRYQQDILQVKSLTAKSSTSGFISDLATSYYLAAESLLRPVVQQDHHSTDAQSYREALLEFCRGKLSPQDFNSFLKEQSTPVHYILLNNDPHNFSAKYFGGPCVGESDRLVPLVSQIAKPIYAGEYLSLFETQ